MKERNACLRNCFVRVDVSFSRDAANLRVKYRILFIGLVFSSVFRFVWLLVLLFQHSSPAFNQVFIRKHLKSAAPLVFSMFLSGSGQYIDGFIISRYFDSATFAVFRFGARELPLVLLLANAFSASMLPGFADQSKLKFNLEVIKQNSQKLGLWLFPLSGVLMLMSHWAFPCNFQCQL